VDLDVLASALPMEADSKFQVSQIIRGTKDGEAQMASVTSPTTRRTPRL
jgi:hypothetical protein